MSALRKPHFVTGIALFGVAGLLLLGIGALRGGQHLQSNSTLCATCHTETAARWRSSGAAEDHATCIECHRGPGMVGAIAAELSGPPNIAAYFVLRADPNSAHADVPRSNCIQCHDDRNELLHQHHDPIPARSGVEYCLQCHRTGGQEIEAVASTGSMVPTCSACHDHSGAAPFRGALGRRN